MQQQQNVHSETMYVMVKTIVAMVQTNPPNTDVGQLHFFLDHPSITEKICFLKFPSFIKCTYAARIMESS